jgi:hypothetical protein
VALAESIFETLTDDDDAGICEGIRDEACRQAPGNFLIILFTHFLTKLGDAIASPKTTLAWVTSIVGAPAYVLGFLVPIRESGSLIPQLFVGSLIRQLPLRKWVWVLGSVGQAAAMAGIGWVVVALDGAEAGWSILALLAAFSLARCFSSVASKDVLGKTIPKAKRGQLTGWSASAAGLASIGVGAALILPAAEVGDASLYGILLAATGALWLVAAAIYASVKEYPGETGGARSGVEAVKRLRLLGRDRTFRRFVMTRALLLCSALSAPYYIALAQSELGSPAYLLGSFVVANGLASMVSAPIWGRFADRSSRRVMIVAALITSGIGLATFLSDRLVPALIQRIWFLPTTYFLLSVAHSGVRVGRKTYVVNIASGNQRTDYVAVSNSVIGVMLLVVGSVGTLEPILSTAGVIGLLALMGVAGAALGTTLPEVESPF